MRCSEWRRISKQKGCTVLDMTGLAQKGGAVYSHVRIARRPEEIHAVRIAAGGARLLLGCDLVVSASADALSKLQPGHSRAIVNSHETITGDFTRNPDLAFPSRELQRSIADATGAENTEFLDATRIATGLFGDSIASNLFMLGYAYQRGVVPLSAERYRAGDRAERRRGRIQPDALSAGDDGPRSIRRSSNARATPPRRVPETHRLSETLDQVIERRVAFLTEYQNAAYASPLCRVRRPRPGGGGATLGTRPL